MDKIYFKEVGANNIVKYIGKECKIAGKKYIIVGYNIDHPYLFLLLLIQKMEYGMMTMLKIMVLVFLIKLILFLRKCLKELLIHIQQLYSCNVVLYDGRYL